MTIPNATWHTSCTCPAAEQERHRLEEAGLEVRGLSDGYEEARQRAGARREAYQAARSRAAGESRATIREIYLAEVSARGMNTPTEPVIDAIVERIAGKPLPAVRVAVENVVRIGKGIYQVSRAFRQGH